jgi:hypothetical protein
MLVFGCLVTCQHSTAGASPNLYNLLPLLFCLVRTKRESPLKYLNSIPGDQFGQEFSHMFHLIASSRLYETNPQSPAYNELDLSKASSTATRASHKSSKSSMRPCLISLALGWSLQVG